MNPTIMSRVCAMLLVLVMVSLGATSFAQDADGDNKPKQAPAVPDARMDNAALGAIIKRLDAQAKGEPGFWQLSVRERAVLVITDERADRMRVMTGVAKSNTLDEEMLLRMMQANFDTALDARYAIAKEVLWSAFIHPLSPLDERSFISAIAQVVNLADSFGTTFSSGALSFGAGDSSGLIQELLDRANSI